ncbi:uncharacterized protein A4U43_C03F740 [Asparagus officinalis]|uniref:Uncharacterized protein n=1 Tax=Asparagus officinalis TaxID=4686 RepID=A0A5P1FBI6_ASPOF|nr:uncharacterized protein A4U43_C03F740 [Asparagus officinalis]
MDLNSGRIDLDSSKKRMIHNQVLRIREEDQRIGDRIGEIATSEIRTPIEGFLCSRPMLPSSPLGNKAAVENSSSRGCSVVIEKTNSSHDPKQSKIVH